jgi:hypothetical protein
MISRWRWVRRKWCCRARIVPARRRPLPRAGFSGFWRSSVRSRRRCSGRAARHCLPMSARSIRGLPRPRTPPGAASAGRAAAEILFLLGGWQRCAATPTPSTPGAFLRLDPLEPFLADPGPRERGTLYHEILEAVRFGTEPGSRTLDSLARDCRRAFSRCGLPDATALVWRMRFDKAAEAIADWENGHCGGMVRSLVETRASLDLPLAGLRLTGMADRLDLRAMAPPGSSTTRPAARRRANRRAPCSIRNWRSRPMPCAMAALPMLAGCRLPGFAVSAPDRQGAICRTHRHGSGKTRPG